ncbi:hypothetical protein ACJX0J_040526, partial [Zea mays]
GTGLYQSLDLSVDLYVFSLYFGTLKTLNLLDWSFPSNLYRKNLSITNKILINTIILFIIGGVDELE